MRDLVSSATERIRGGDHPIGPGGESRPFAVRHRYSIVHEWGLPTLDRDGQRGEGDGMGCCIEEREVALDHYCGYLTVLADAQIGARLRGKVESSDLVQQTLLKACQRFASYRGSNEQELRAWLRSILTNEIIDQLRKVAGRGGEARERSLHDAVESSSLALERLLRDQGSSPSHKVGRAERILVLSNALVRLPGDQRLAIELRYLQGRPLEAIANEMGKTIPAVSGLLRRGLHALRADLGALS